ncbi:hypothetical protein PN36_25465 [Candidatus Thiomargarita nelsonii]|uniref:Uncharacterized protein n=1 Tax=Candidatus Thiomargarita nelsonii TaxID=1003181 RepID=A0A0A6RMT6_9GAMM|nr:hypothetical protein PN36_25465 [Candidatus Thiomargarita nelsonii]
MEKIRKTIKTIKTISISIEIPPLGGTISYAASESLSVTGAHPHAENDNADLDDKWRVSFQTFQDKVPEKKAFITITDSTGKEVVSNQPQKLKYRDERWQFDERLPSVENLREKHTLTVTYEVEDDVVTDTF